MYICDFYSVVLIDVVYKYNYYFFVFKQSTYRLRYTGTNIGLSIGSMKAGKSHTKIYFLPQLQSFDNFKTAETANCARGFQL